ncbi:MAG: DUF3857 and transglutaminase domain-containing protein [Gammaproteobacteria bacterium]|nr:DUF3857 and transglutaminase domain-containing protein [Gammaproteobacteria bacterium]
MTRIKLLIISLLLSVQLLANQESAPNWVNLTTIEKAEEIPSAEIKNGIYYLLVDSQLRVPASGQQEYYFRNVRQIVDANGVEDASQLYINYDPTYQSYQINAVQVIRNGEIIDKYSTASITEIQREPELEQLIYSGEKTVHIVLDDIREGDILDFNYTIKGSNPIFGNLVANGFYFQWTVPVKHRRVRIVWEKSDQLYFKQHHTNIGINEKKHGHGKIYDINAFNTTVLHTDENTPSWFDPFAYIEMSNTDSWADLVEWSLPLFNDAISTDKEIKLIAKNIRSETNDSQLQLAKALQYVQNNIRYFGVELGTNSHAPSIASETLERRYGDCKDKTVLLISILKELNIESYPALINTEAAHTLADRLPNAKAFDHVIAKAVINDVVYWLDPTRKNQDGPLSSIYQPNYTLALPVQRGAQALESIEVTNSETYQTIIESFEIPEQYQGSINYRIKTLYSGYNAERQKSNLSSRSLGKVREDFLKFYQEYYPDITVINDTQFSLNENGQLTSEETYSIDNFWEVSKEEDKAYAWFYANAISTLLYEKSDRNRKDPLFLGLPLDRKQTIYVNFPDDNWEFESEQTTIENSYFLFNYSVSYENQQLKLEYHLKHKLNYVKPENLEAYFKDLNKVREHNSFAIYRKLNTKPSTDNHLLTDSDDGNEQVSQQDDYLLWLGIFLSIIAAWTILYLLVFVLWLVDSQKNPHTENDKFYPISIFKLISMHILTFGFYTLFWYYKNWEYIRDHLQPNISPAARAFFNLIWLYPLTKYLSSQSDGKTNILITPVAATITFAYIFIWFGGTYLTGSRMLASCLLVFPIIPLAYVILKLNSDNNESIRFNSRWLPRHFILVIASTPAILMSFGSDFGLLPSDRVIPGTKLLSHDVRYFKRQGIIKPGQTIRYFYSDAMLFLRDDGNGFTDKQVFSYWREDDKLNIETALFEEIADLEVKYSDNNLENTIVTVKRKNGTEFLLFVSREKRLDKIFVNELRKLWEATKDIQETS